MDPNQNLKEQLEIVNRLIYTPEGIHPSEEDTFRLAELVEALDWWIESGGALPDRWGKGE